MTRREVLAMLGASGATVFNRRAFAQGSPPACVVRPQQTEGPYFVDEKLDRSDIRSEPSTGAGNWGWLPSSMPLSHVWTSSSLKLVVLRLPAWTGAVAVAPEIPYSFVTLAQ